jgi:hypothetical protein
MIKSLASADATLRDLAERLRRKVAGSALIDTVRETRDSDGWPMLFLSDGGTETAGSDVIAIRMKAIDAVSKDVFNNALNAFTPHSMEVAYELDANAKPEPEATDLAQVLAECAKTGVAIQIKEIADATAVSATSMDAAAVAKEIEADDLWPTKGR